MAPGLRELVTGQDACAPDGGQQGNRNAMNQFVDAMLGKKGKQVEQAAEVGGLFFFGNSLCVMPDVHMWFCPCVRIYAISPNITLIPLHYLFYACIQSHAACDFSYDLVYS